MALRQVVSRGGPNEPDLLLRPVDIKISAVGTLVADFGSASIKSFSTADGAERFEVGRGGRGPFEFFGPPQLLGRYRSPLAFQGEGGRIYRITDGRLVDDYYVPRDRPYLSSCQVGDGFVLLQSTPRPGSDPFFLATFGPSPEVRDSIHHPWSRMRDVPEIARQTPLSQADDSTCVLLPLHHQEIAVIRAGRGIITGRHPEALPTATETVDEVDKGTRHRVARGAVYGMRGATSVANLYAILYEGKSRERNRIVDFFDRELTYVGSALLPIEARSIAGHADTLAIVGYEEDIPALRIFVVTTLAPIARP